MGTNSFNWYVHVIFLTVRNFRQEAPANECIEILYNEQQDKRLTIFWRPYGNYGFTEEHLSLAGDWLLEREHTKPFPTLKAALAAAHRRLVDINKS